MTESTGEIVDSDKPRISKTMVTISKILIFLWGLLIGVLILNPFGYVLTFYHYVGFALITFFIIIFYNGMTAGPKPDQVEVKNFVKMK